ncbi:SRP14-domain-containing protein [Serendipita vermifera]|nr:SRP14-domain-containing protein [Serendipita vermifera]
MIQNHQFLKSLEELFQACQSKGGSVWLTHKRLTYEGQDLDVKSESGEKEYPCLLRATDGKHTTISTHILSNSLPSFHAQYGTLLKSTMTQTLRKRDKKKEKARLEELALKKKKIMEGVQVVGPKRGSGRKKRVRLLKVKYRLEESRRRFEEREKKAK